MLRPIFRKRYGSIGALWGSLLILQSCLNSSVPSSDSRSAATTSSDVSGISPFKVHADWPDDAGTYQYKIYSGDLESSEPLSTVNFSFDNFNVSPGSSNELKVYRFNADGKPIGSKPLRHYRFQTWKLFENAEAWLASTAPIGGIEVSWSHLPWAGSSLSVYPGVEDSTKMSCYFVPNGTLNSKPFEDPSAIVIEAPAKNKKMIAGTAIAPLTRYAISCKMVYADGKESAQKNLVREVTSSRDLVEVADNASIQLIPVSGILVSRALSFLVNNANSGLLTLKTNYVDSENYVQEQVLNFAQTDIPQNALVRFDTPFPSIPGKVYGGKFRITGTYLKSADNSLPAAISAQDFYVKTVDNFDELIHSRLEHILGGQAAGEATASADFNCDGHDDLAVGMPDVAWQDTTGKVLSTGIVVVYYGSEEGLYRGIAPSLNPVPAFEENGKRRVPPIMLVPPSGFTSPRANSNSTVRFGAALAAGNFNRDFRSAPDKISGLTNPIGGRPCYDLAIGMPELRVDANGTGTTSRLAGAGGGVLIRYGSHNGLANGGVTAVTRNTLNYPGTCPGIPAASEPYHPSNTVDASANADKITPPFSESPASCAGTLFYPFLAVNDTYACKNGSSATSCQRPGGLSLEAADLEVGLPAANRTHSWEKAYYRSVEFSPILPLAIASVASGENQPAAAQFGISLSAGDLNGDGFEDLAVGAPGADAVYTENAKNPGGDVVRGSTDHIDTGAAFVYFGSGAGLYQETLTSNSVTDECTGLNVSCAGAVNDPYRTGVVIASEEIASPMKFTIPFTSRAGKDAFGTAVAIANIDPLDHTVLDYTETRNLSSSSANTGTLWVGAPGRSNRAGAVFVYRPFEGLAADASPRPVQQQWTWQITGSSDGEEFGAALAKGAFRNPRLDKIYPAATWPNVRLTASVGLDRVSRNAIREVVATGAPGFLSGAGRVYVFASNDSTYLLGSLRSTSSANSVAQNREQTDLCEDPTDCRGSIIPSPQDGARFGEKLGVIRRPYEMAFCSSPTSCKNAAGIITEGSSSLANKWQPVYSESGLDSLMVGAPGADAGRGRAFVFRASTQTGLQASTGFEHDAPEIVGNSKARYGTGLTGGFFNFKWANPGLAIGMPGQTEFGESLERRLLSIGNGGSIALFEPSSVADSTPNVSSTDLILVTPNPESEDLSFFSLSSIPDIGHTRARGVGDINCDGFSDAIMPHNVPSASGLTTSLLLIFGSPQGLRTVGTNDASGIPVGKAPAARLTSDPKLGLAAPQWIDTSNWTSLKQYDGDPTRFFAGVGDINGDGCDDLVVGRNRMVLLYGSQSGIVLDAPSENPIGRNPKIISFPNVNAGKKVGTGDVVSLAEAIDSAKIVKPHLSDDYNGSLLEPPLAITNYSKTAHRDYAVGVSVGGPLERLYPSLTLTETSGDWRDRNVSLPGALPPICHGDFNGDGFGDVTFGTPAAAAGQGFPAPDTIFDDVDYNWGPTLSNKVPVSGALQVYYGSEAGVVTGVIPGQEYDYTSYGTGTTSIPSTEPNSPLASKCASSTSPCPSGQMRPGMLFYPYVFVDHEESGGAGTGSDEATSDPLNGLVYSPFRPMRSGQVNAAQSAVKPHFEALLDRFGEHCLSVGDLDADGFDDLVVPMPSAQGPRKGTFVLFRGSKNGLINNTIEDGTVYAAIVKPTMSQYGSKLTLTSDSEFNSGTLGASGIGVGDINGDRLADFALGLPNLVGEGASATRPKNGGVAVFLGRPDFVSKTWGSFVPNELVPEGVSVAHVAGTKTIKYEVCDRVGSAASGATDPCYADTTARGLLIRPDNIDGDNREGSFGLHLDAAGDVNADGYADLLVPMPSYNAAGLPKTGAGLVFFGKGSSSGHLSAGYVNTSGEYVAMNASRAANCDSTGCTPYLLMPEFATDYGSIQDQNWMVSGGLILKPIIPGADLKSRLGYMDYGSRNGFSQDLIKKSSDLLLAPRKGNTYKYKATYDHLGGLGVWY